MPFLYLTVVSFLTVPGHLDNHSLYSVFKEPVSFFDLSELNLNLLSSGAFKVGPGRLELPTSRLSGVRSNHLSYGPVGSRGLSKLNSG